MSTENIKKINKKCYKLKTSHNGHAMNIIIIIIITVENACKNRSEEKQTTTCHENVQSYFMWR